MQLRSLLIGGSAALLSAATGVGALATPAFAAAAGASIPSSDHRVTLRGSSPAWGGPWRSAASALSRAKRVSFRVYLAPRGGDGRFNAAVAAVSPLGSAGYRNYLTPAEYHARFAPTSREVSGVRS